MLLGKRQRPPVKRTTSMSNIKFEPELSDHQIQLSSQIQQLVTVDEHRQVHHGFLDQRLTAMVSPRVTQRRYSADYSTQAQDFMRSCSLCKRKLVPSRDIYMYRGDGAFCSLECRQHQITVDESKEKVSLAVAAGTSKGKKASAAV